MRDGLAGWFVVTPASEDRADPLVELAVCRTTTDHLNGSRRLTVRDTLG